METNDQNVEPVEPTTSVEVPENDGDDAAPDRSEDKTPNDRPSRKERREAKKVDFNAELRQRDELIQRERAERESMARDLAELRGRMAERERATAKDPYEERLTEMNKRAKDLLRSAAAMMEKNPQQAEALVDEHNGLMQDIAVLKMRRELEAEQAERQANAPQPLPPAVQHDVLRVAQEFPWLQTDQHARQATDALVDRMMANGAPPNYTTLRAAAAQTAMAFGLGGEAPPSDAQRQRFRGVAAGAAAGNGEGKRTVEIGRTERALAQALANRAGNGKSGDDAVKDWVAKVGSRLSRED